LTLLARGDRRQADRQHTAWSTDREAFGEDRVVAANGGPVVGALFMRRSFIMHHCFAVVWSLELNFCQIKFIKQ
jgi:hypothetical protein